VGARVVVVGGGVGGLATAFRLIQADPSLLDVAVLEASDHPGGKLGTVSVGGLDLPAGADSFLARKPWAVDLCRELSLELEAPAVSSAYLWTDRGLVPMLRDAAFGIPGDVGDVLRWPGLSGAGRRRALLDLLKRRRRGAGDEALGALLRRRLGDEATDLAIAPLLAGLHAGDVDRLSVRATFPELAHWEAWQGSLIRGSQAAVRHARRGDPGPIFLRPVGGVGRLPESLAAHLGERIHLGSAVASLEPSEGGGWVVTTASGSSFPGDAVAVAIDAAGAARLLGSAAPAASADLSELRSAGTGVVLLVYGEGTRPSLPDGSGFVVPRGRAPMTAATFLSTKWPEPRFGSRAVVRCYVGGAGDDDVLDASDDELVDSCARHLGALVALPAAPASAAVVRWPASMPQYEVGHLDRVGRIRERLPAGIVLTGQAYDGVGVPDVVRAAGEATEAIVGLLAGRTTTRETAR
jgi:oxygen-dependent protoporphyrinogen oxidase